MIEQLLSASKVNQDDKERFKTIETICKKLGIEWKEVKIELEKQHHQIETLNKKNEELQEVIKQVNLRTMKLEDDIYVTGCFNYSLKKKVSY